MKRWTARILICLTLGAVTTVAVAWGCAQGDLAGRTLKNGSSVSDGNFVWRVDRRETPWITQFYFLQSQDQQKIAGAASKSFDADLDALWDDWARRPAGIQQLQGSAYRLERIWGFGWPLRAMSYREEFVYNSGIAPVRSLIGGLLVRPGENQLDYSRPHALPLQPIWSGYFADTIFFAACWLTLGSAAFALWRGARTAGRSRRGECVRCGYDLRGDLNTGCPECGWNRERAAT